MKIDFKRKYSVINEPLAFHSLNIGDIFVFVECTEYPYILMVLGGHRTLLDLNSLELEGTPASDNKKVRRIFNVKIDIAISGDLE